MQLCEQYRPQTWGDVIGQDKVARIVAALRPRGLTGRAYWISGPSGTGKTTIARLLAAEVAESWAVVEVDATDLLPTALRDIESTWSTLPLADRPGRAYLVNEAHGLRRDTVRQLLTMLERIPRHVLVVFTTTTDGQASLFEGTDDAHPLLSRCTLLSLTSQGLANPGADRLLTIATTEGLRNGHGDDDDRRRLVRIIHENKGNLRAALQAVESGALL